VLGRVRSIVARHEALLRSREASCPFQRDSDPQLHSLFRFVYTLCRIRGFKTIVRFLPHDAADLEPVLHLLQSQVRELCFVGTFSCTEMRALACAVPSQCVWVVQDRDDHTTWQTRYSLLLWLSMLAHVPFDICSIDSTVFHTEGSSESTLVGAILEESKGYLSDPGPTRDAAAVCLYSLLKRPDMQVRALHGEITAL
jgi:tubulin-specific chaperone D